MFKIESGNKRIGGKKCIFIVEYKFTQPKMCENCSVTLRPRGKIQNETRLREMHISSE